MQVQATHLECAVKAANVALSVNYQRTLLVAAMVLMGRGCSGDWRQSWGRLKLLPGATRSEVGPASLWQIGSSTTRSLQFAH